MWIARVNIETDKGIEHQYERAITLGKVWTLVYKHLNKKIHEIAIYQEKQ